MSEPLSINKWYHASEEAVVAHLCENIIISSEQNQQIAGKAATLITAVRSIKKKPFAIDQLLETYDLSSQEGLALMCLAEALLRIPDNQTQVALIRDKIGSAEWEKKLFAGGGVLGSLTNLGLATADHLLNWGFNQEGFLASIGKISRKLSEPAIRSATQQAMKGMGRQFVMGQTIEEAISLSKKDYRYSFDMLGEGAKTKGDAIRYTRAYHQAIRTIANHKASNADLTTQPSISIKLTALHPRYEVAQTDRVFKELFPIILDLAIAAKEGGIALTIDAEESERLTLSLQILERLAAAEELQGWDGLGLAVQAYQKRAWWVIDWIIALAQQHKRRFCIRLVKGAYWDTEIKRAQERGHEDYPVFTQKSHTDLSYLACAQKMLAAPDEIYPQFATHNAQTAATILTLADGKAFEFQRLHGMGEELYDQIVSQGYPCRIYAPVGKHSDLLAYLVRRLLENGANTSFVHKIRDQTVPLESLIQDPLIFANHSKGAPHPAIALPKEILLPSRPNSRGINLYDQQTVQDLYEEMEQAKKRYPLKATPLIVGRPLLKGAFYIVINPATYEKVGEVQQATLEEAQEALHRAHKAHAAWSKTDVNTRAGCLESLAQALENKREVLMTLLCSEAGKTIPDALSEVREAIDFCWYYAAQARQHMSVPTDLPGPTGEFNQLSLSGRGIFLCISPWNFPLAIFLGQVAAALVTGNCVLAKPAQQTALIAYKVCSMAHLCGIPEGVLQFIPMSGRELGEHILPDPRIQGVAFTGSTDVGWQINQTLAARRTAIAPLIAETGGINAMIVDSSALTEQVVTDVITSAFQSAGQRCSALRLLFLQEDIADRTLDMLKGAVDELTVGNPYEMQTDVGPVIDASAKEALEAQIAQMSEKAKLLYAKPAPPETGAFVAPQIWELQNAADLTQEIFGPVLYVVRFKARALAGVIEQINASEFGLTLGVHSRIDETIELVRQQARVGNLYVNRNMIGAVVGVQPFGGEGLSGTGPKAGGPNYLLRFTVERTFTRDTTAAGGNATLMTSL